ncbi:UPF0335 protein [Methylopila jiangsuensis]|uniref:UPF0335 protein n=1 Tax=Methylopila jiangsuensis TaxID=586230 RepID=A0A9W6N591_9HYPH|nr:DUF2312 domain-containing protein [Methylopila jiangsuensis]MDR6284600.1 uncharacterized protein (UPF0335 family) [Methylopila jiangsuensis]GLK78011.1 UPF0335 protein [Methylopila jiangsuensis]
MSIASPDSFAKDHLRSFVDRIESEEAEIRDRNQIKSEIYKEAKAMGFDVKALRKVIGDRRQDPDKRAELEAIVDLYKQALGMPS